MKKVLFILALTFGTLMFTSCEKDDLAPVPQSVVIDNDSTSVDSNQIVNVTYSVNMGVMRADSTLDNKTNHYIHDMSYTFKLSDYVTDLANVPDYIDLEFLDIDGFANYELLTYDDNYRVRLWASKDTYKENFQKIQAKVVTLDTIYNITVSLQLFEDGVYQLNNLLLSGNYEDVESGSGDEWDMFTQDLKTRLVPPEVTFDVDCHLGSQTFQKYDANDSEVGSKILLIVKPHGFELVEEENPSNSKYYTIDYVTGNTIVFEDESGNSDTMKLK